MWRMITRSCSIAFDKCGFKERAILYGRILLRSVKKKEAKLSVEVYQQDKRNYSQLLITEKMHLRIG